MESASNSRTPRFQALFVDQDPDVVNALAASFGRKWPSFARFIVGNIFRNGSGILVTPTNSEGDMSGGLDLQLRSMFPSLEERLQSYISTLPSRRLKIEASVWLEYEDRLISTDLTIARGALELISKQHYAPEVLKIAQDALNKLSTMSDSERHHSFMQDVEQGAAIPPVDPIDVRHVLELYERVDAERYNLGMEGRTAIGTDLMATACSPGADVGAVWLRSAMLGLMIKQGVLADWQHGTQLDDGVYRVAATMPLSGFQFDPTAFVRRLREEFSGQS
jgi:hypothetical protein